MGTIADLEGALQLVLEASAPEHGLASGWQRRRGPLSPGQFGQTLVFGFLEDPHATLVHLARVAHTLGARVTPQAVSQRFTGAAVALLRGVLQDALGGLLEAEPVAVARLRAFPGGVYLNDSTQVALHDDWTETWPGSGIAAALKLPARLDLLPARLDLLRGGVQVDLLRGGVQVDLLRGGVQVDLTPARQHDSVTRLACVAAPAGSLVVEDLGYLQIGRMQERAAAGIATLVPWRHTLAPHPGATPWRHTLAPHPGAVRPPRPALRSVRLVATAARAGRRADGPGLQRPAATRPLRLVAWRAHPATAARHRASLSAAAQDHGRIPAPHALALADWIVMLPTPEQASAAPLGTLMRWQIELLFKLGKDQGKLDETRGWKPERIEVAWYAKLLGLLLQHWVLLTTGWQWADRSLVKAGQTIREYARCLCLGWHDPALLRRLLDRIAQSLASAARIGSHCHQHSAAFYAQTT